jgi:hypothetical protein
MRVANFPKSGPMIVATGTLGVAEAQRGFRRVKGHKEMRALNAAPRPAAKVAAVTNKVA